MAGPISQTLPYFCDPKNLPGPLPSPDEIEAATEALPGTYEPKYKRVVAITQAFVVKHGVPPWVSENEGHALLLLSQYPSIPVPRLYAMYREGNRLFLIMERKDGVQLGQVWGELTQDDKRDIMGQLKAILSQIRTIPSPGLFGNAVGGPLRHRFFLSVNPQPEVNGPFRHERDFSMAMAIHSRRNWRLTATGPGRPSSWSATFPPLLPATQASSRTQTCSARTSW